MYRCLYLLQQLYYRRTRPCIAPLDSGSLILCSRILVYKERNQPKSCLLYLDYTFQRDKALDPILISSMNQLDKCLRISYRLDLVVAILFCNKIQRSNLYLWMCNLCPGNTYFKDRACIKRSSLIYQHHHMFLKGRVPVHQFPLGSSGHYRMQ